MSVNPYPPRLVSFSPSVVAGTLAGDATPAVEAAGGAYSDDDVVSNSDTAAAGVAWVFADMATVAGSGGEIIGASLTTSAPLVTATFRLWLFDAIPDSSELDDNAAFSLAIADQDKLVNVVDFAACAPLGAVAGSITAALSKPYVCAAADTDLYGILQITDAETNAVGSMVVVIKLMVRR